MEDRNKRKHHHQDSRHNNNGKRHRAYQQDHQNDRVEYRRSPSSKDSSHSQEDDAEGHYEGREGDVIKKRYRIIKRLGIGTFGAVFKCHDSKHGDVVALKVVRSIKRYIDSAQIEARVLHDLFDQQKAKGVDVCLKMYSHFKFDDHYCIVCERLGLSLLDLIKKNRYKRTPLRVVRDVSRQLLKALDFLTSIGLVHTDLKLENVLFERSTLRAETVLQGGREVTVEAPVHTAVKLIDFGGATYATDRNKSRIINTRQYRSPEVTLELGWSYPSDMWSAGCIVAEVYSGELLFGTHDELEHLALMEQALEPFPPHMVRASPLRDLFEAGRVKRHCLPRASLREVEAMRPLQRYFQLAPEDPGSGIGDLVKAMLRLDPAKRVTPRQGLLYDFVTEAVEVEGAEEAQWGAGG
ncbi:kinase-like domain-containing protein [Ochromonadaceae sp. CCMP2298]|nr:kinase-like domain-containing protein [Ochromonadaceae sp. CCMP2298]